MMKRYLSVLLMLFGTNAVAAQPSAEFSSDRISVEARGDGPDVVLIPGLSSSPRAWESTVAAVPSYRYHLVQVAGFAGAPAEANAAGPVVAAVAEEIARYIDEAGLEEVALVGHSLGGTLAMMVAARHPDMVSKVMVVDMFPFMGAMFGGPEATAESVAPIAEQVRTGIAGGTGEERRRATEQVISTMVRTESLRAEPIADSLASDAAVSGQAMYDIITTDLRPELTRIDVPMTVLWAYPPGAPVSAEQMEGFYRASYANVPDVKIKRIPDAWHFIMLDEPEAFRRELRAFLGE